MKTELLLIQIALWVIVLISAGLVREFYTSTKTNGLRLRMIALFSCKIWIYGGAAVIFLIWPPTGNALFRILLLNTPMVIVMLWLWGYVRTHLK